MGDEQDQSVCPNVPPNLRRLMAEVLKLRVEVATLMTRVIGLDEEPDETNGTRSMTHRKLDDRL